MARISGSVDTVSWPDIRTGHGAAAGLVLLWLLALTVSWVRFMRIAPAAQGRYFFPAAPALLLLWAWSWWGLGPRLGRRLAEFTVAGLAVLALLTPWWIIRPAYTPPPMSPAGDAAPEVVFGAGAPQIGLLPGSAPLPTLHPGQTVALDVTWRSLAPVERDYSVFVHLVDEVGLPAAQVDTLPGRGLWATSQWQPGTELRDRYFLHIPETIYTPGQVRWVIGLYHAATGERLPRMDVDAASSLAGAELGRSSLVPREAGSIPNPMQARFGDNISLVGYAFSARVLRPGEPVTVRLYWQARGPVQQDYVAFVHLLDEAGNMFGGHDAPPAPPTSIWAAGQMVEDVHTFILPPETPPGRYRFELGLYTYPDMDRLVVLDASGAEGADRLFLGPVRVEAAP
ncbi:MAG: hypothetical protein D6790_01125 [Caldilineae bacterium]|nr:MAG: hypothetical protein D6790_01125 [Caldilineae bacterium]